MKDFRGKRVWIIGASAGIGAALARALAREGAILILSARDSGALKSLADDCGGAETIPFDLGVPGELERAASRISGIGLLDIVICTVAVYEPALVRDMVRDRAERMLRINILGILEVGRVCPPLLREGGQLVLFGSVAGYFGLPKGQPYSATKAAVNNIAESLAVELWPRVDVRLVCPGFVRSRLTAQNDFRMPALISAEEAAERTLSGLKGRRFEIHFPRRFTVAVKVLSLLPYWLALRLTRRIA